MSSIFSSLGSVLARSLRPSRAAVWLSLLAIVVVLRPDSGRRPAFAERARAASPAGPGGTRRPNLLILIADDHRGGTLGIDGDPRNATPNLDALARQGARFTRAYCNAPVCTASRQSLITGRLPHAVGVTRLPTPLSEDSVTLGTWLSGLGYDTGAFGKMHFNGPSRHGFEERADLPEYQRWLRNQAIRGGDQRRPWKPFESPAAEWLNSACLSSGLPYESMDSTYFADRAIDFLSRHKREPFALVVSFYDPHSPFHFPREWTGRFDPKSFFAPPVTDADRREQPLVFKGLTDEQSRGIQAAYFTSLSFLDHQVGRVLDALARQGLENDTVVVFLGDNGYMLGEHGRFEKHCFYEPAVNVPLLVRWKGHLKEGVRVDAPVELVDVLPTVMELLDAPPPTGLHGRSLVPLLNGSPGASGREFVFSEYLENEEAMLSDGRFKLIVGTGHRKRLDGYETANPLPGPYERLFDRVSDPAEAHDLAADASHASVKSRLVDALYERLVLTQPPARAVPRDVEKLEAIRRCLVPPDRGTRK